MSGNCSPKSTPLAYSSFCKLAFVTLSLISLNANQTAFAEDGKDHPLIGRYEGSKIDKYKQSEFDEVKLLKQIYDEKSKGLTPDNSLTLQGKSTLIRYTGPKGRSALEVASNYQSGLTSKGFQILYSCGNEACMVAGSKWFNHLGEAVDTKGYLYAKGVRHILAKLSRPQGDVYASITVGDSSEPTTLVNVVELKPMETNKIAFVDASKMQSDIDSNGKVALYGILFDTGSDKLKAESMTTLAEIAKLLKQQPSLNLVVTGHTDNQGEFAYNVDLSNRRAQAVKASLTSQYGIAANRLVSFGAGMAAPVASNTEETGRSKNRRVELVKR
ncbi:MAG: OmpA family protein [Candidatus Methylopumilus sp.]